MKLITKIFFVFLILLSLSVQKASAQTPPMTNIKHVFIILLENHDLTALNPNAAPYINNTLFKLGAHASNYHNVPTSMGSLHPSEPNYVFLEGGTNSYSDFTFTNDNNASTSNSTSSTAHLATLLTNAGYSWKEYAESMPAGTCPINSSGSYAAKHDPFVFFKDISGNPPSTSNSYCASHHEVLTVANLQNDLNSGNVANYNFLTPNLCNDMHDCSVTTGDTWLSQIVPIILNSNVYKQDGAIFITMDEGGNGNAPIQMVMLSPFAKTNYTNNIEYSHASFVKSVERIFNLNPLIGHAADAATQDLSDFFGVSTQTAPPVITPQPTPISNPSPTPSPTKTATPAPVITPMPTQTTCAPISTNIGTATVTINTPVSATYRVWSRIMPQDSSPSSYYLQVDNNCPILVGGSSLSPNLWSWISIDTSFTLGSHTLKLIGNTAGLKLDRIIATDSFTCSPSGTGDNCIITMTPGPIFTPSPTTSPGIKPPSNNPADDDNNSGNDDVDKPQNQKPVKTDQKSSEFHSTADAEVDQTNPNGNSKNKNTLMIDSKSGKNVYLRFHPSTLKGKSIKSAIVQLTVAGGSTNSVEVKRLHNVSWSESRITFNNSPKATVDNLKQISISGKTINIDVTELVKQQDGKAFTLVLSTTGTKNLNIYSDESNIAPPVLIVN